MSSESGAAHEPSEEPHDEEETPAGPSKECQSVLPPKPTSPVHTSVKWSALIEGKLGIQGPTKDDVAYTNGFSLL